MAGSGNTIIDSDSMNLVRCSESQIALMSDYRLFEIIKPSRKGTWMRENGDMISYQKVCFTECSIV